MTKPNDSQISKSEALASALGYERKAQPAKPNDSQPTDSVAGFGSLDKPNDNQRLADAIFGKDKYQMAAAKVLDGLQVTRASFQELQQQRDDLQRQLKELIASNHDLLAALIRARDHLIMDVDRNGCGVVNRDAPEALAQARAAIAAAEGRAE